MNLIRLKLSSRRPYVALTTGLRFIDTVAASQRRSGVLSAKISRLAASRKFTPWHSKYFRSNGKPVLLTRVLESDSADQIL
jgi:hypothetical protein